MAKKLSKEQIVRRVQTLMHDYIDSKEREKAVKKESDLLNAKLKELLPELEDNSLEHGGYSIKLVERERKTFNEVKLIEKLRELKIRGVVRKKEYVDMDRLEKAIYTGKLDASSIAHTQVIKKIPTLTYSLVKDEKDEK